MDSNYIIKVYDKDDTFKRTLSRKDINGDIRYSSVLNSGFSTLPLRIQNKREEQTNTETTYERILDDSYDGTVSGWVTIVDDSIVFNGTSGFINLNVLSSLIAAKTEIQVSVKFNTSDTTGAAWSSILYSTHTSSGGNLVRVWVAPTSWKIFFIIWGGDATFWDWWWNDWEDHTLTFIYKVWVATRIFVDWEEIDNTGITSATSWTFTNTARVSIWQEYDWGGTSDFFDWSAEYIQLHDYTSDSNIESIHSWKLVLEWVISYYSGLKYDWTPSSPTTILNALPDNTEITTTVSSTLWIDHGDIIKVIDPNQNVVTTVDTWWWTYYKTVTDTPIYTGQVIEINHNIAPDQEYHDVDVIGIQTLLNQTLYEHWSSYTFTRKADPAVILKEVIDLVWYLDYTIDSIETYGSDVSLDFEYTTCMDAVKEIISVTGWIVKYDADGTVYFTEKIVSPTINHKLDFTGEVIAVYDDTKSFEIVNKLELHRDWWGGTHYDTYKDLTSQWVYWIREKYIHRWEIANQDTADDFGNAYIERYANPLQQLKVVVNNKYDIASVKVGDTVKIYWYYNASSTYYIYKLDFTPDNLNLYLNEQRSIETTLYKLTNN